MNLGHIYLEAGKAILEAEAQLAKTEERCAKAEERVQSLRGSLAIRENEITRLRHFNAQLTASVERYMQQEELHKAVDHLRG